MSDYDLTPLAKADIFAIWVYIAEDNEDAANRVQQAIYDACKFVAESPLRGHGRQDLTKRALRFWTLARYPNYTIVYRLIISAALSSSLNCTLLAQQDRLAAPLDSHRQLVLAGGVKREAQTRYDHGPVDPGQKISGVSLLLKMSAVQQADLDKLLEDQRNPASPDYHNWLTPDQYADRFGLSPADIAKITARSEER